MNWAFRSAIVSYFIRVLCCFQSQKESIVQQTVFIFRCKKRIFCLLLSFAFQMKLSLFVFLCVFYFVGSCFVCGSFCAYVAHWNRTNGTFVCFVLPNESYSASHLVRSIKVYSTVHIFGLSHTHRQSISCFLFGCNEIKKTTSAAIILTSYKKNADFTIHKKKLKRASHRNQKHENTMSRRKEESTTKKIAHLFWASSLKL